MSFLLFSGNFSNFSSKLSIKKKHLKKSKILKKISKKIQNPIISKNSKKIITKPKNPKKIQKKKIIIKKKKKISDFFLNLKNHLLFKKSEDFENDFCQKKLKQGQGNQCRTPRVKF